MDNVVQAVTSSLASLERQYETVAHNLANAGTTGFKRLRTSFSQALDAQLGKGGSGAGSQDAGKVSGKMTVDFSPGEYVQTGRALDLALEGPGFFVVQTPEGPLYTRNGQFRVNAQGGLVDSTGRPVAGDAGPINLPAGVSETAVAVGSDGTISVGGQAAGKLRVVNFTDPTVLRPVGQACFQAPEDASPEPAKASVAHGARESSNVSPVEELVSLITITRLYESNLKGINTRDESGKSLLQVAMG